MGAMKVGRRLRTLVVLKSSALLQRILRSFAQAVKSSLAMPSIATALGCNSAAAEQFTRL
ncbi:hypothetical protein [Pseudomonas chlororaphis]|uniref:hypothetical protein n=1 Tax=Pseudomonas chlororaphis TaxID=587753 RepID=UPI000F55220B|nr:hypothetical protein [Pseudomonas chlororaphis]AZD21161.1 hypothetical protein C4K24_1847 [Pseudomonas chlororaphis subsp. aurantiaca]AZD47286.1 hypothetical protein C4K20_1860 [Pseudomonas chlororaphis subsp. aurantiaca]